MENNPRGPQTATLASSMPKGNLGDMVSPISDVDVAQLIARVDNIALRLPAAMRRSKLKAMRELAQRAVDLSQAVVLRVRLQHPIDAMRRDVELLVAAFNGILLLSRGARVEHQVIASVRLGQSLACKLCDALARVELESPLESFSPPRPHHL